MNCPKCRQPEFDPLTRCPNCQFTGDPDLIQELARINWLLKEIPNWHSLSITQAIQQRLSKHYSASRKKHEIALELRPKPFTAAEASRAWPQLYHQRVLLRKLMEWQSAGWLLPRAAGPAIKETKAQIERLQQRLEALPPSNYPSHNIDRLNVVKFLIERVQELEKQRSFASQAALEAALRPIQIDHDELEILLGIRPAPKAQEAVAAIPPPKPDQVKAKPTPAAKVSPPPRPAVPFKDRLWRTLLSERTLHAILFLGIFLLFAAAISFVVWGWKDFTPPLRVAIPTGFTLLFFGLGWYVRTQTNLHRSGIALSAIATLLIPIDFYTVYVNFDIAPELLPEFWLITSLFCVLAYTTAALSIQSRLFGYLVGMAAGSAVLALVELGNKLWELSRDWSTAGLSLLALLLLLLATRIEKREKPGRWEILARAFPALALLAVGVLMPLTFVWRYLDRTEYDVLHYALTVNWWVGGLLFGWGAIRYRSRGLGILAAMVLPFSVYLAQAAVLFQLSINSAWQAFGMAGLVPLYWIAGYRWLQHHDPIIQGHGRTTTRWGVALLVLATLWPFTDLTSGAAAAGSHAILMGAMILAAVQWQRPSYLYLASLFSLSAATFSMTELDITLVQMSVGWASLAIIHLILSVRLGYQPATDRAALSKPIAIAGYAIAALAAASPTLAYQSDLLVYTLGNWIALATWGAFLAQQRHVGFRFIPKIAFHWLTAAPLPLWLWVWFTHRRPPDASLASAQIVLAWGLVALAYRLGKIDRRFRLPWRVTGLAASIIAPIAAFGIEPNGLLPAICMIASGLLYFADSVAGRHRLELAPAGLVSAWGFLLLLDRLGATLDALCFALAFIVTIYILLGLWVERKRSRIYNFQYLLPLYSTALVLALAAVTQIYLRPVERFMVDQPWTDVMRVWGAGAQLILGVSLGLFAWGRYQEIWGHAAAWLGAGGGAFIAIAFSQGRGSSAAKAALMAIAFVLAERSLHWLQSYPKLARLQRVLAKLAWRLYCRPLLVTGWAISAGTIGLALFRNFVLLGGYRIQQTWAAIGLLLITGLYALAARLFRRPIFVWLAAGLSFVPWTILTNLRWFVLRRPSAPGFAFSWVVLAWLLFLIGLWVKRGAGTRYARPLAVIAHLLLPASLLWGVAHVSTSRFSFGLAIPFYGLAAWLDYRQSQHNANYGPWASKFLYPAVGLVPVWCIYLLAWWLPGSKHEHYGLMLLAFGGLGLAAGRWFGQRAPPAQSNHYALPCYLTAYISAIVGAMLVAHIPALLSLVLLADTLLLLVSAWLFRDSLWTYPAGALVPISLLLALNQAEITAGRQGWWLLGLAAVYLALAALLRRIQLRPYSNSLLAIGFALLALALPLSSLDRTGALWGYAGAALIYAISAIWLRQALLLTPASALAIVPYVILIQRSTFRPEHYGLALFPGAILALAMGWLLDQRFGRPAAFPWSRPEQWFTATAERFLTWWGLPLYALGFGLAAASPLFTQSQHNLTALNWALLVPVFGWGLYRFRRRGFLLAMAVCWHLAAGFYLQSLGWGSLPASFWLRFLPVTLLTTALALAIEHGRGEGSPLEPSRAWHGWSRPLYALLMLDVILAQLCCLEDVWPAATVTLVHALLIALLAMRWTSHWLPFVSALLGAFALHQWLRVWEQPISSMSISNSQLALAYGAIGFGISLAKRIGRQIPSRLAIWDRPLRVTSLFLSAYALLFASGFGLELMGWTLRALVGLPFRHLVELTTVYTIVTVLSLNGLLYIAAAVAHRQWRLGYLAIGMLLGSWWLLAFFIQEWDRLAQVQWYAIPAGCYLLGIGYLEWQRGNRHWSRWLDYVAILLMLGSLFWQTWVFGWRYALMLGAEGLLILWFGSARRLRRFFYAGLAGVMLATAGQLVNSLQSINQWLVFGVIGLLLFTVAAIGERKFEDIKASLQVMMDTWE